jgi:hypothetical protein
MRLVLGIVLTIVANAVALSAWPTDAAAQKRVALVIGNSAYQHTSRLVNPINDATDMSAALKSVGFVVIDGFDLSKATLELKIRAFEEALQGAAVGLLFYAGHGMQAEGRNYLVPVDARIARQSDIEVELVRLDLVLEAMRREDHTNMPSASWRGRKPKTANLVVRQLGDGWWGVRWLPKGKR